jgi:hypothetical protein
LDHHHFENGLATANFLPNGHDRALRRSFWMIVGMLTLLIDSSA